MRPDVGSRHFSEAIGESFTRTPLDSCCIWTTLWLSDPICKRTYRWVEEVLHMLQVAGLKLKPFKCTLLQRKVRYLRQVVSEESVATNLVKLGVVEARPIPKSLKKLKAFLGTVGYYHKFVEDIPNLARPLMQLTHKETPRNWDQGTGHTFQVLKDHLTNARS